MLSLLILSEAQSRSTLFTWLCIRSNGCNMFNRANTSIKLGAQWLSGRVLDSRLRGCGFEPHRRYCVVVLEQDTFILA